jgi:hypothetical protein
MCALCGIRKPMRFCPGVAGGICSICCGTGREETIDCPLDCEYLQAAHRYEKTNSAELEALPNSDIEIPDSFLEENEILLVLLGSAVVSGARKSPGITDYDLREALESLVRTYRALQSGLFYETMPVNPYAAAVFEAVQARVADLRKRAAEAGEPSFLRDAAILKTIVVLQRLEYLHNNARKRSRAFLDFISRFYVPAPPDSSGIDAGAERPGIIL